MQWSGLTLNKPRIMGVLNVTPDSFSDGGKFITRDAAVCQGERLIRDGADILDIGGESTRPGAKAISPEEEQARVIPVIEALRGSDARLSIDTRHAQTAKAAIAAGAHIWNDVTALRGDPASLNTAIELRVPLCLMHMRGEPQTMQSNPTYGDVVAEVKTYLSDTAQILIDAGVEPALICLDVGIGFGKTLDHNLKLLNNLDQFIDLPFAHLLGVSRKSFIEKAMVRASLGPVLADERLPGSLASVVLAYSKGCRLFRVHDVAATQQALEIVHQINTNA